MYRHIALVTVTASLPSATQPNQALFEKLQRHFKIELDGRAGYGRCRVQAHLQSARAWLTEVGWASCVLRGARDAF